jgi:hypothetical protein
MTSPLAASALDDLRSFLELGLSIVIATRDDQMKPAISRCGGARLGPDGVLRFLVAMPEGTRTVANLDANGMVAFSCVRPLGYRTFQIKGEGARRIEWPGYEEIALAHRPAFRREIEQLGLPESISGLLWSRHFVPFGFTPTEVFDQTPGPAAGLAFIA